MLLHFGLAAANGGRDSMNPNDGSAVQNATENVLKIWHSLNSSKNKQLKQQKKSNKRGKKLVVFFFGKYKYLNSLAQPT